MIGLDVRKLVALDMLFLGTRVIVAEYAVGVLLPGMLALFSFARGVLLPGLALGWISVNYVPMLVHAVDLARSGTARREAGADYANPRVARSYSWRQLWILVPLGVIAQDLMQRYTRSA